MTRKPIPKPRKVEQRGDLLIVRDFQDTYKPPTEAEKKRLRNLQTIRKYPTTTV